MNSATDMAATMERLEEYRTHNAQFCKRLYDFLSIMFTAQVHILCLSGVLVLMLLVSPRCSLGETNGIVKPGRGRPTILDHKPLENYLGRYGGLMLYLKEMDESMYGKLCAVGILLILCLPCLTFILYTGLLLRSQLPP